MPEVLEVEMHNTAELDFGKFNANRSCVRHVINQRNTLVFRTILRQLEHTYSLLERAKET